MKSKKSKQALHFIKHLGISFLSLGGVFIILEFKISGVLLIVSGGILYSIATFFVGFEKNIKDPHWEIVFPELALGIVDEDPVLEKNVRYRGLKKTESKK